MKKNKIVIIVIISLAIFFIGFLFYIYTHIRDKQIQRAFALGWKKGIEVYLEEQNAKEFESKEITQKIAEDIAPLITEDDSVLSFCYLIQKKGYNPNYFMQAVRKLFLDGKVKLNNRQIKELENGNFKPTLADLWLQSFEEMTDEECESHIDFEKRPEYVLNVLKSDELPEVKKRLIVKAVPQIELFFREAEKKDWRSSVVDN